MQISGNQELFDFVRKLIDELPTDDASKFQEALSASSMPTEILGEIRVAAQNIINKSKNGLFNQRLKIIISYIDKAFDN